MKLVIVIEVDVDTARVDPHEVAEEILHDSWEPGGIPRFAGNPVTFVSAEWETP